MPERGPSKQLIFEAALKLFSQQGYNAVSMRQIARESGIAVASIYNHFPSKRDILDEIYDFYYSNMERLQPDLDALLDLVPILPPHEVMKKTAFVFPSEILEHMGQATAIVVSLVHHDKRADDLMDGHLIQHTRRYDIPLLTRMMELDLIEPIDVEYFSLLHSNYQLSAAVRHYTNHAMPDDEWLKGLDMLYQLIREKPPK